MRRFMARELELSHRAMEQVTKLEMTLARQGKMLWLLWIAVVILVAYAILDETR